MRLQASLFCGSGLSQDAVAAELRADTVAAFERYVQLTEARMIDETAGRRPFFWMDRLAEPERPEVMARLRRGEIVVDRLQTRDAGKLIRVPGGMCHHRLGTVFAADAGLARTVSLMDRLSALFG